MPRSLRLSDFGIEGWPAVQRAGQLLFAGQVFAHGGFARDSCDADRETPRLCEIVEAAEARMGPLTVILNATS
jgi:hypothetical protein